jgi:xanthine dehydrogenase YagS FAD-binding subunit
MKPFAYTRPETIDQALAILDHETRPLAGGTDLLTLIKGEIAEPAHLVDIKRLPDLNGEITLRDGTITIGALATLARIETDPLLAEHLPALGHAASVAATPQLRNMATIGGNILQRPRCWYFRNEDVHCWLKGGEQCFARGGDNREHAIFDISPCVATHPSDFAAVLVAYGATVHYRDAGGAGHLGIEEFFRAPEDDRRIEHVLPERAVITHLTIPAPGAGGRSRYVKAMDRKAWAFALAGVAIALEMDGDAVSSARVVLGGVAPVPVRVTAAEEALAGVALDAAAIGRAAEAVIADAAPLSHNGYKVPLVQGLVRKALREIGEA